MNPAPTSSGRTTSGASSKGPSDRQNSSIISRVRPFVSRIFAAPLKPLTPKVDIVFHTGVVDMIGQPVTSSHYSLSGYVRVSLPALPPVFNGRLRAVHEVTIVIEGGSEYADKCGRYTPLRLFTTTLPLFTEFRPMLVPSHDAEFPDRDNLTVAIPFDLRIPGWVPPTHESGLSRTSYGAIATVTVGWQGSLSWRLPGQHGPHPLDNTYTPTLGGVERTRTPFKEFIVRRHRIDTKVLHPWRRSQSYILRPAYGDPIDCNIFAPHWCDIHGGRQSPIHLYIRLRKAKKTAEDLWRQRRANASQTSGDNADSELGDVAMRSSSPVDDDDGPGPMSLVSISVVFQETTLWSSEPLTSFMRLNPIPQQQPERGSDRYKLLGTSIGGGRPQTAGLKPYKATATSNCGDTTRSYKKDYDNGDVLISSSTVWKGVHVVLPMPTKGGSNNTPVKLPSPDIDSPFIRVKHSVSTTFVFRSYDNDEETITIDTPLRFATSLSTYPSPGNNPPPAFTDLFFENGEARECDPLPPYSASPDASMEGVESQAASQAESTTANPTEPTLRNGTETAQGGSVSGPLPIATNNPTSPSVPMEGVESTPGFETESTATSETQPTAVSTTESAATNETAPTASRTTGDPAAGGTDATSIAPNEPLSTATPMEGVESTALRETADASTTDPSAGGASGSVPITMSSPPRSPDSIFPAPPTTPLSPMSGLALTLSSSSLASSSPPASPKPCSSPLSSPAPSAVPSAEPSSASSHLNLDSPGTSTRASSLDIKDNNLSPSSSFSMDLEDDSGPSSGVSATRTVSSPLSGLDDNTRQPKRRRRDGRDWTAEPVPPPRVARRVTRSSSRLARQASV